MPRDDLSIDLAGHHRKMPQTEHQQHQDCAAVLDEWMNRVANLPAEIAFMQEEIYEKDRQMSECLSIIAHNDAQIQKWIKMNGSHVPNPKEKALSDVVYENYKVASQLQKEKMVLAQKTQLVIDKHTRFLDGLIKALQDKGEFPNDPDIPSLLRPSTQTHRARLDSSVASMPLAQITNPSTTVQQRNVLQQTKVPPNHAQLQHHPHGTNSHPTTPAAASILFHRNSREGSLPASKRARLGSGVSHLPSSGLTRQTSLTPGTPNANAPSFSTRAGSAGPRSQKASSSTSTSRRPGPQHRPTGPNSRKRPGKSSLSRIKRPGKNSPSSTADSELSEAETGSVDDEEEVATPRDVDLDMLEEDEGEVEGDDKKYCMCQSVSYGDMVACDNESCPYEWFHWSCVGLKSEPVGTWICPICEKSMKSRAGN